MSYRFGMEGLNMRRLYDEYLEACNALKVLASEPGCIGENAKELLSATEISYQNILSAIESLVPLERSLVTSMPAPINRIKYPGIIAFRAWKVNIRGRLRPAIHMEQDPWKSETTFADKIPERHTSHGLYAHKLAKWDINSYGEFVSGLVELSGKVIEHSDGVFRAERARIACIFLTITKQNEVQMLVAGGYQAFKIQYPTIPVYIMTHERKARYILREMLIDAGEVNPCGQCPFTKYGQEK